MGQRIIVLLDNIYGLFKRNFFVRKYTSSFISMFEMSNASRKQFLDENNLIKPKFTLTYISSSAHILRQTQVSLVTKKKDRYAVGTGKFDILPLL